MSTERCEAAFGWGVDAARALRLAEATVEELCRPAKAYRAAAANLDLGLTGEAGVPLCDVVGEACAALRSASHSPRHPSALAHMVPPPATVAVIADFLKAAANQCAFTVEQAPLAPHLERAVLEWAIATLGFPKAGGGLITGGGTMSNYAAAFLALDAARRAERSGRPCVIASDQCHYSIAKAARLIGLGQDALWRVPTGVDGRIGDGAVARAVRVARTAGFSPFLFVCTGGTTSAGTLEPVQPFALASQECDAWLHIDGAHGAFVALTTNPPQDYWTLADSVAWDAHKSLFTPYPAGLFLVRDIALLAPFAQETPYAFHDGGRVHPGFHHLEGSRGLDALKIWMTIRHFGREGLTRIADHLVALARQLAERVLADASFELVTAPDTNIVCFRSTEGPEIALDELNAAIQRRLHLAGHQLLSRTSIAGRTVLRAVLQNPLTRTRDLDELLAAVRSTAERLRAEIGDRDGGLVQRRIGR